MSEPIELVATVPPTAAGQRLDQVLAQLFPEYSRSRLQQWVKAGEVSVDGQQLRPRDKLVGGEAIRVRAQPDDSGAVEPEAIGLEIVYEDDDILVIDKPVGLVVHPGAGNAAGTVQNALLHHEPALAAVPRAGIVHRLDKDTSGLMVVAKTLTAHKELVEQLQERSVTREYLALVNGTFTAGGNVDAPIGRHPRDRVRMAVVGNGKPALTRYRVAERFRAHTLLRVSLETGRTHQIRVHMTHIGHPLVGDQTYTGRQLLPRDATEEVRLALRQFPRQALHATRLALEHPVTGETLAWESPAPADLEELLALMRRDCPWEQERYDG